MENNILYNNCISIKDLNRYTSFIESRKQISDIYEKHHIVPKSLGGLDNKSNIINLSPREHYIAHMMLWKAIGGKMTTTIWFMSHKNTTSGKTNKIVSGRQYSNLRDEVRHSMSERFSGKNNPGFKRSQDERARVAKKSADTTKRLGLLKGENHPLYGIGHTDDTKAKIKANHAPCNGANNSHAKSWCITDPKNNKYTINGTLKLFCSKHNLSYSTLIRNRNCIILKSRNKNTIGWKLEENSG